MPFRDDFVDAPLTSEEPGLVVHHRPSREGGDAISCEVVRDWLEEQVPGIDPTFMSASE
jgi:hypothetical protein